MVALLRTDHGARMEAGGRFKDGGRQEVGKEVTVTIQVTDEGGWNEVVGAWELRRHSQF